MAAQQQDLQVFQQNGQQPVQQPAPQPAQQLPHRNLRIYTPILYESVLAMTRHNLRSEGSVEPAYQLWPVRPPEVYHRCVQCKEWCVPIDQCFMPDDIEDERANPLQHELIYGRIWRCPSCKQHNVHRIILRPPTWHELYCIENLYERMHQCHVEAAHPEDRAWLRSTHRSIRDEQKRKKEQRLERDRQAEQRRREDRAMLNLEHGPDGSQGGHMTTPG